MLDAWKKDHPILASWIGEASDIPEHPTQRLVAFGSGGVRYELTIDRACTGELFLDLIAANACPVCFARGGHWAWCQCGCSQPPPPTERAPAPAEPEMCCGGTCVRALCTFHGPDKG